MADTPALKILVHNVGHHELYVRVKVSDGQEFICRPESTGIRSISQQISESMETMRITSIHGADLILNEKFRIESKKVQKQLKLTRAQDEAISAHGGEIVGVEFRNLASAMEHWIKVESEASCVLLVSTAPLEPELAGSATDEVSRLMGQFGCVAYPDVQFEALEPLKEDPFRFSSLMDYVRNVVRNSVDGAIGTHVKPEDGWANEVQLTLSASTGTTPMISALHEAFRDLSPTFLHIPRARQRPQNEELPTVESYSFREITQRHSVGISELRETEQALVEEMKRWRDHYLAVAHKENELQDFWLRKGNKPVLAVLGVQDGPDLKFHHACNLEVSLPTGTLCAERNAIGSALAANPALKRSDIKMVGVLSLPDLKSEKHINPLGPCGACMEWLRKVAEATPDLRILTFEDVSCENVIVERIGG